MEQLSIEITIAGRPYKFRVAAASEETVRAAAKIIDDTVSSHQQRYNSKDAQDALAIAALQYVIKLSELENRDDVGNIVEELESLDKLLEEYITLNIA